MTNQQNKRIIKSKKINYNLRAIVFIIIIILFILFRLIYLKLYFVLMNNIKSDNDEYDENFKPDNETIYYKEKFDSYIEAFNKSKDFINNNIKGILLNTESILLQKKCKISIVIPCLNCKDYILRCIRSIQNQNFSDFEIIIVDDFSDNHTQLYLDQRIKIISNKRIMGIFLFKKYRSIFF